MLVAFSLVRGLCYAMLNPPFQSPDENSHLQYVASLLKSGGVQLEGAEAHQPPLYYWAALPAYFLLAGQAVVVQLLSMRLLSVLMTVATVVLAYKTARTLRPKDTLVRYGTAIFVALVPTYGLIGASANNDNLAILASSGMIYLVVRGIAAGFTPRLIAGIFALIGMGLGAKATTWPVIAVVMLALVVNGVSWGMTRRRAATLTASLLGGAVIVALLLGPLRPAVERTFMVDSLEKTRGDSSGLSLDPSVFAFQFRTFWATFYNDSVWLPFPLYWLLATLGLASAFGLVTRWIKVRKMGFIGHMRESSRSPFALQLLAMAGVILAEWLMSFVRFILWNSFVAPVDQSAMWNPNYSIMLGRFLFPAIVPIAFFFVWGLTAIIPNGWRWQGALAVTLFLLAVDWTSLALIVGGYNAWQ